MDSRVQLEASGASVCSLRHGRASSVLEYLYKLIQVHTRSGASDAASCTLLALQSWQNIWPQQPWWRHGIGARLSAYTLKYRRGSVLWGCSSTVLTTKPAVGWRLRKKIENSLKLQQNTFNLKLILMKYWPQSRQWWRLKKIENSAFKIYVRWRQHSVVRLGSRTSVPAHRYQCLSVCLSLSRARAFSLCICLYPPPLTLSLSRSLALSLSCSLSLSRSFSLSLCRFCSVPVGSCFTDPRYLHYDSSLWFITMTHHYDGWGGGSCFTDLARHTVKHLFIGLPCSSRQAFDSAGSFCHRFLPWPSINWPSYYKIDYYNQHSLSA